MHPTLSLPLLALASIVSAVQSPKMPKMPYNAVDGYYVAYVNDSGDDVHTMLAPPNNTGFVDGIAPSKPKSNLVKRGDGYCWCGCGFNMVHGDCDAAVQDLRNQMSAGVYIGAGLCYYSIRGTVAAFACNPYNWDGSLSPFGAGDDIGYSDLQVTNNCGWYVAGTYAWGYWTPYEVGYLIYNGGTDFVHTSILSNSDSC